jgi:DNA-binding response OmpR family regulator
MDADHYAQTRRRILLLEQDEYIASLLHMLLHREGFEISAVTSNENAHTYVHHATPPDLIFLDGDWINDERNEILSFCSKRIEWQVVPIIVLQHHFDEQKIERLLSMGVTDYLLQPFEPGQLLDVIQRYLR